MLGRGRAWLLSGALVVAAASSVLFLEPVLLAPVAGDDRKWYPEVAAVESWSVAGELGRLPEWWEKRTGIGRVNVMTDLERRTAARAVVETSVGTGTPTYVVNGVLKGVLAVVAVLTLAALLRTVRHRRTADGALVRLPGRTVVLGTLAGSVLFALGSQPAFHEVNGRNGWVNYPTHSYGAVVSILGLTALVVWASRLIAEGRHRVLLVVPLVLLLVLLAVVTNFRYELMLPVGPLALVALILVPVTPADRAAEGRRAKWITGVAFVGVFLVVAVALRLFLSRVCAVERCYPAVTPRLSPDIVETFWLNVVSSVPGATASEVTAFVGSRGVSTSGLWTPTVWSLAVAVAMAAALAAGWWLARPSAPPADDPDQVSDAVHDAAEAPEALVRPARGTEEVGLLVVAATLCVLGALGAAGMMSLSAQAQSASELGLPYRNVVLTWAGLSWAVALLVVALGRSRPRAGGAAWAALTLVVGVAAACLLPANERSLQADRVDTRASAAAFAALVNGDLGAAADAHRCRLVPLVEEERVDAAERFDEAFQRYWDQEFCRR